MIRFTPVNPALVLLVYNLFKDRVFASKLNSVKESDGKGNTFFIPDKILAAFFEIFFAVQRTSNAL